MLKKQKKNTLSSNLEKVSFSETYYLIGQACLQELFRFNQEDSGGYYKAAQRYLKLAAQRGHEGSQRLLQSF